MRRKLAVTAVLCLGLLSACATTSGSPAPLQIAITIDDLPVHGPVPTGQTSAENSDRLIATLTQAKAPAMIFVNGHWTETEPATSQILAHWDEAGFQLANHGWSHRHLNEMELPEFERELVRNDQLLRRYGGNWRWFRYPFLDEGETAEKRSAARRLLAGHGYSVASVTMDFSDWAWTAPYARCLAKGDKAAIQSLEDAYLKAARESADFSRTLSRDVHGRDIPYVLLLHGGAMTSHMMPRLLEMYRDLGFSFVPLAEAQSDAAYREEMDPSLPPRSQGLEGLAHEKGIALPPRTSVTALLESSCP